MRSMRLCISAVLLISCVNSCFSMRLGSGRETPPPGQGMPIAMETPERPCRSKGLAGTFKGGCGLVAKRLFAYTDESVSMDEKEGEPLSDELVAQLKEAAWRGDEAAVLSILCRYNLGQLIPSEGITSIEAVFRRAAPDFADRMILALNNGFPGWQKGLLIDRLRGDKPKKGTDLFLWQLVSERLQFFPDEDEDASYCKVEGQQYEVFQKLVAQGGVSVIQLQCGPELLDAAVISGDEALVKKLLEGGVSADGESNYLSQTPFWLAAQNGHKKIVKILIEHDANIAKCCFDGKTILHLLADHHSDSLAVDMMKFICEEDVAGLLDINACDRKNDTPLHMAANAGNGAVVGWLLEQGAKTGGVNAWGDTALGLAKLRGFKEVTQKLELAVGVEAEVDEDNGGRFPVAKRCRLDEVQSEMFTELADPFGRTPSLVSTWSSVGPTECCPSVPSAGCGGSWWSYSSATGDGDGQGRHGDRDVDPGEKPCVSAVQVDGI